MCVNCLRSQVDITEGISRELQIQFCRRCGRYFQPPTSWVYAEIESRELLSLCLKRIKGMKNTRLVDASFLWTEPHSRRLKVKITIQKEVFDSTILQQSLIITYVVHNQQCESCSRLESKQTWRAVVQTRQKVDHKRTFLFVEQLIIRHGMHTSTVNIKEMPDGIDFFFNHRSHAMQFTNFLHSVVPCTSRTAKQLISQDDHSNTYNYKFTFSVEMAPVCKDDALVLPPKQYSSMGGLGPLVLCSKVGSSLYLLDPTTLQMSEITAQIYFKNLIRPTFTVKHLTQFVVLDIEPLRPPVVAGKYSLAEAQICRATDMNTSFTIRTHLGNILHAGDLALGYDLTTLAVGENEMQAHASNHNVRFPEVVLVKKFYPDTARRRRKRRWNIKRLDMQVDESVMANKKGMEEKRAEDVEAFMRELEEDEEMRTHVNLYRRERKADEVSTTTFGGDEEDIPKVPLEELLDPSAPVPVPTAAAAAAAGEFAAMDDGDDDRSISVGNEDEAEDEADDTQ